MPTNTSSLTDTVRALTTLNPGAPAHILIVQLHTSPLAAADPEVKAFCADVIELLNCDRNDLPTIERLAAVCELLDARKDYAFAHALFALLASGWDDLAVISTAGMQDLALLHHDVLDDGHVDAWGGSGRDLWLVRDSAGAEFVIFDHDDRYEVRSDRDYVREFGLKRCEDCDRAHADATPYPSHGPGYYCPSCKTSWEHYYGD